uniref:Glycosyltransferase 2-like domain-containing protein n=1 Tax=Biomphalaria glabrata TaxID=6526 RepID=A0A2C9K6J7_BIOGL
MSHTMSRLSLVCLSNKRQTSYWLLPVFTVYYFLLHLCSIINNFLFICIHKFRLLMEAATYMSIRHVKHALSVLTLVGCVFIIIAFSAGGAIHSNVTFTEAHGYQVTFLLYFLQFSVVVQLPFFILNFLGLVLLNVFTEQPKLQRSPLLGPFLCFRVVTRGMYPDLVKKNVQHNLEICKNVGLHNFIVEVVTDVSVNIQKNKLCREIVVPEDYRTGSGSLFKARALQYALEPEISILEPGDWIVHLDEETLLTEGAVIGIINFTGTTEHAFGQGVITYGNGEIVNWVTTLADSIRVGIDYGCLRFCLGVLHKPLFSWKGSFIVAKAEAEMTVSFDHGPEASIAEDCFFACVAFSKGFSFGFVDGTMFEQSTFTIKDFVRQRRRWMQGILLTALSKKIPLRYKFGPVLMSLSSCILPLNLLLFLVSRVWSLPSSVFITVTFSIILGTIIYLFILGTLQTFGVHQHGVWKCFLLVCATLLCGMVACCLEYLVAVLVFWMPKTTINNFYIVNKEIVSKDYVKVV